ncbi:MAG: hypothetical protein K9N34_02620 [Candidatus Marinimicrobia bacterium]|nr:hypothetical protein [Candidatus Neomarinimicrobiota bacterium]MCF7841172.1 hypothetical protein [Candidatus Neomarinimicrobiota bacterium]MCF7902061.1 hypothetical protein [Candidatus Neomarinimicrobiota bacterium]
MHLQAFNKRLASTILIVVLITVSVSAQYSTKRDIEIKKDMQVFVDFITSDARHIKIGNQKRALPKDLARKKLYWQKELARGKKGDKPAVDDSTAVVIPVAEALRLADRSLEFTHWSPVYNLAKVWGGRVEFNRNGTRYEANYFWYNNKLLDLMVRPWLETDPGNQGLLGFQ